MNSAKAARENVNESTMFFTSIERCTSAEPLIEYLRAVRRDFAHCHVAAHAQAAEGCYREPLWVFVANGERSFRDGFIGTGLRSNNLSCNYGNFGLCKWLKQVL